MSNRTLYTLVATSLQDYILRGDKLRHMVGASELIENLPNALLIDVMREIGINDSDYVALTCHAGGARILFNCRNHAEQLAEVMPLVISLYAPGLQIVQDIQDVDDSNLGTALSRSGRNIQVRRNLVSTTYPIAGPLVSRTARTGLPVSDVKNGEPHDAAMTAKYNKSLEVISLDTDKPNDSGRSNLIKKMLPTQFRNKSWSSPTQLDDIATSKNSYIAILHADANKLGSRFSILYDQLSDVGIDEAAEKYLSFSKAIADSTELAIQISLTPLLSELKGCNLPFRPMICAGDDLTIILPAQYALNVAKSYLSNFEQRIREALPVGDQFTASAGIVYVNKSFPFAQAYRLCESLCSYAKSRTNRERSSVAFRRVTTTFASDFEYVIDAELTAGNTTLTMMPYEVNPKGDLPCIDDLRKLADAVKNMPRGSLRNLLTEVYVSKDNAQHTFERINDVVGSRGEGLNALKSLNIALERITEQKREPLWKVVEQGRYATPLLDAIELLAAESYNDGSQE